MFLEFYGLREQPFGVTPDARFLFDTPAYREAWASLWYGIETGRGFIALIAAPGMGKTTLIFRLLEHLRGRTRTAFLFQTQCNSHDLLRGMLTELGCDVQDTETAAMHQALNHILVQDARTGKPPVVIIDEAQNLGDTVLETVRLLSDFETPRAKLLQIVLAGQTELARRLSTPQLAQLRQRISVLCRLAPLTPAEVQKYIEHRLRVAGHNGLALFTPEAYSLVASLSGGIPRNVNNICFHALSLACALEHRQVDVPVLEEVSADLDLSPAESAGANGAYVGENQAPASESVSPPGAAPNVAAQPATVWQSPAGSVEIAIGTPSRQCDGIAVPQPPATSIVASAAVPNRHVEDVLPDEIQFQPGRNNDHATVAVPATSNTMLDLLRRFYKHAREQTRRNLVSLSLSRMNTRTAALVVAGLMVVGMALAWHRNIAELAANPGQLLQLLHPVSAESSALQSGQADVAEPRSSNSDSPASVQSRRSARRRSVQAALQTARRRGTSAAPTQDSTSGSVDSPPARDTTASPDDRPMFDIQDTAQQGDFHELSSAPQLRARGATDAPPPAISKISSASNDTVLASLVDARRQHSPPALQTVPVSEGVVQGKLIKTVLPVYPAAARQSHREGAVVLSAEIATDGRVQSLRVLSGDNLLVGAAVAAVERWRYEPSYLNGNAINSERQITINFKLGKH